MGPGKLSGETIDVIEVAVGLVLVLLVQLGSVELLIVEFGGILMMTRLGGWVWFDILGIWNF